MTVLKIWEPPSDAASDAAENAGVAYRVGVMTNVGGANDQGFNQGAWDGLRNLTELAAAADVISRYKMLKYYL